MNSRFLPVLVSSLALLAAGRTAEPLTFERDVRPILKAYCLDCHGGDEKLSGQLDLRLRRFAVAGGSNGPALVPGEPAGSLLLKRMRSGEMPPGEKKVPPDQIAIVERWIANGAAARPDEPETLPPGLGITPEERSYWFYRPLRQPPLPPTTHPRVRTPIDAFIFEKLAQVGLDFAPDADRLALARRAAFDLTGLPPEAPLLQAFLRDPALDAYERYLDQLLASPSYGERWGRHWLDGAGYADSEGDGTHDTPRSFAWRYRDYVIRSLNADKPLDQFVIEQLAGDLLVPTPWTNLNDDQIEKLAATGFLRCGPDATASGGGQAEVEQTIADTLKIVSSTLLGSSVGCAQCHDHRYDPIPQQDYFRLRAVFEPGFDPGAWRRPGQRRVSLFTDADRARCAEIDAAAAQLQAVHDAKQAEYVKAAFGKELEKFPAEDREKLKSAFETPEEQRSEEQKQLVASNPKLNVTPGVLYQFDPPAAEELKKLAAAIDAKRAERPAEPFVDVFSEVPGRQPTTRLYHRGDYRQPMGPELVPGDLTVAGPEGQRFDAPWEGRRLAWAKHLTSGSHPLFNRVMANRIWLHHFGRGIVDTPGEFGRLGQLPTHPELLDWLARELPRRGWSLKAMHRLIMTSTVYRQTSVRASADLIESRYARFPVRRLEAEAIRDHMLLVAGRLDRTPFGPSVAVTEDTVGQVIAPENQPRRGVYLQQRRSKPVAFLAAFDAPNGELNCDRRVPTTAAPQALMLMNSEFVLTQAGHLAKRVQAEANAEPVMSLADEFAWPAEIWQYGYGRVDSEGTRLKQFMPLPHFTGGAWQGGPVLPDPKLGWVIVHAGGGHAGNDADHAAVRRWVAPRDGTLTVIGKLNHPSPHGDGVRGRIISTRQGRVGEWIVKTKEETTSATLEVRGGDWIDFVVDCQADCNCDSFEWAVKLTLTSPGHEPESWESAADFRGPPASPIPQLVATAWRLVYQRPATVEEIRLGCAFVLRQSRTLRGTTPDPELAALTNLCQQLLASNEFLYVD